MTDEPSCQIVDVGWERDGFIVSGNTSDAIGGIVGNDKLEILDA